MSIFRSHKAYTYYRQQHVTTYGQVFGLPIVVNVPQKGCTYRTLYETIVDHIKRYVNISQDGRTGDLFNLVVVNSYGSQEVQKLKDRNQLLKLTSKKERERGREFNTFFCLGQTYIGCDWVQEMKEKCYDVKAAEVSSTTILSYQTNPISL